MDRADANPQRREACAMLRSAVVLVLALACRGSEAAAPPNSVGPESLTIVLRPSPDTIVTSAAFVFDAVARNASGHLVFARYEAPKCGLIVHVTGPISFSAPPVCRPNLVDGTSDVLQIGDSLTMGGSVGPPIPAGSYRVQAFFDAVNGRSPIVERIIIVR
jgi:hypothetical protein